MAEAAESEPLDHEEPSDSLVLAIPRRELYSIQGFTTQVEMRIIDTLNTESWYALPDILREDIDAKEVRVGILVQRLDQALVTEDGVLLHTTTVPPEIANLGEGLLALREFARAASRELLQAQPQGVQLFGYLNDDAFEEVRPLFILAYIAKMSDDCGCPPGMTWVAKNKLNELPLDTASSMVAAEWLGGTKDSAKEASG